MSRLKDCKRKMQSIFIVLNITLKKCRIDRERQRLQHEVIELTATIDQVQKEKVA